MAKLHFNNTNSRIIYALGLQILPGETTVDFKGDLPLLKATIKDVPGLTLGKSQAVQQTEPDTQEIDDADRQAEIDDADRQAALKAEQSEKTKTWKS